MFSKNRKGGAHRSCCPAFPFHPVGRLIRYMSINILEATSETGKLMESIIPNVQKTTEYLDTIVRES